MKLPIVFGVETEFGANISDCDAWEGLVGFDISNGDNKILDSVLLAIHNELGLADDMGAC